MKKFLAIFALLASVLAARAELSVEWIDGNTIRVSGDGYTVVTNVVYTNSLGTCTNCVQISPEQMRLYKTEITSACDSALDILLSISSEAYAIVSDCSSMLDDIATFQRFGNAPSGVTAAIISYFNALSNYVYSVDNSQTLLDRSVTTDTTSAGKTRWVSYNNGIYDYATQYVSPVLADCQTAAANVIQYSADAEAEVRTIKNVVSSMSESACSCQGDGAGSCPEGGGGSGDCPCGEQLEAIKDYVEHIDDDFHVQLENMSDVTNFIPRMDSYARLVSRILYNDATIVVDDGENSWSNVYRRGYSDLYNYDKSNILQRIELLLFGLTPISTTTNWGDVADIDSEAVDVQEQINGVSSTISEGHDGLAENVTTIRGKISALFDALNFFGSSNMSTFTINDPFQVFDVYEVEGIEPNDIDGLEEFRNLIRPCFQVFYWVSGIAFMIAFWYFVVSFVVRRVFGFLKFFNNLLT